MSEATAETLCEFLDWDSSFFKVRIARVKLSRLDEPVVAQICRWGVANRIDCLYFLADAHDPGTVALAERNGFGLVDIRLTLTRKLGKPGDGDSGFDVGSPEESDSGTEPGFGIRVCKASDLPHILTIARISHTASRFFFDQRFPRDLCERLYEIWLERSFEESPESVWVAECDGLPVGYMASDFDPQTADGKLELLGVLPSARRHGTALALVRRSLEWFVEKGAVSSSIVTQARNIPAQRLFQRLGFRSSSIQLWYHKWF